MPDFKPVRTPDLESTPKADSAGDARRLLDLLEHWKPFRAVVVGDFMLDELAYGDAERLSPDAPVPVLRIKKREHRPGGASNVSMDLAALGAHVSAIGVCGCDSAGRSLRETLGNGAIDVRGVIEDPSRPTTLKQSLIGLAQGRHPQKMFRVDEESREPLGESVRRAIMNAFERALADADVVIIEDYAKGVCDGELCQGVIARAKAADVPVFVDPARGEDPMRYKGATSMTPNRSEAELATGLQTDDDADESHNLRLAQRLKDMLGMSTVVLTLDRHGALLLDETGKAHAVPTRARQVYDVSGAGDMFIAAFAGARANGWSWKESVELANTAAGLEVEVFGVQPIPLAQLKESLAREAGIGKGKLRSVDQAVREAAARRARGQSVVFTNGCFDVLHSGHVTLLEKAAALGDFLVVGLNSDASVKRLKGPERPVNTEMDRARVLGALESVGAVVVFDEDTPLELIRALLPNTLVKGADYTKERVVGADIVEGAGGRVELVPLVEGKSTTSTIRKLSARA